MTDRQTITVNVSCALTGFDEAREALDSLTKSAEAAAKALDDLGARPHGGIIVKIVGRLAQVEIKPVARDRACVLRRSDVLVTFAPEQ